MSVRASSSTANMLEKVSDLGVIDDIAKLRGRITKADVVGKLGA